MAKVFKKIISGFFKVILNWLEDLFILTGVSIALFTTYQNFGLTIGNYSLAFVLLVFGFVLAKK